MEQNEPDPLGDLLREAAATCDNPRVAEWLLKMANETEMDSQ